MPENNFQKKTRSYVLFIIDIILFVCSTFDTKDFSLQKIYEFIDKITKISVSNDMMVSLECVQKFKMFLIYDFSRFDMNAGMIIDSKVDVS